MSLSLLFWILMIFWFFFGLWVNWPAPNSNNGWRPVGGSLLLFILLTIVGWQIFGPVLHR